MDKRMLVHYILGIPKTIYFNFKYLKFKQAIKIPILLSHRVVLKKTAGSIEIKGNLKTGMIKIGFGDVAIFDSSKIRTIWQNSGKVIFNGTAIIGPGTKLSIKGELSLGDNFIITSYSSIICYKKITIESNCLMSWDVLIMDTDFHKIYSIANPDKQINQDKPIYIGKNVWIGCRCLLLKGCTIDNNCVIAANSTISKHISGDNQIIAGNPARIIKNDIIWDI